MLHVKRVFSVPQRRLAWGVLSIALGCFGIAVGVVGLIGFTQRVALDLFLLAIGLRFILGGLCYALPNHRRQTKVVLWIGSNLLAIVVISFVVAVIVAAWWGHPI